MDINQEMNGMGRLNLPICKRIVNNDISQDFTLPDYYPEIRRVLYVKETMLPVAKFISGNKLDVNGVVDYSLVYVSNEGKLCSAPMTSEYAFSVGMDNIGDFEMSEGVSVMVHSEAESSTVRVISPRKLQIRSRLRSNVNAWGKKSCAEKIEGIESPVSLQRKNESGVCVDVICESSDMVSVEDEYVLPNESCRVALADSSVLIDGCKIEGDIVRVNGHIVLKMLIINDEDDSCERVSRKMDFEAESDLGGIDFTSDIYCRVDGCVTDMTLNVEEGKVLIDANLALEICMTQNKNISYTSDVYSTEQTAEVFSVEEFLPTVIENRNINFSQSERIELSELGFQKEAEIVDVSAKALVDECNSEYGRYVIKGDCRYNIICRSNGEYSVCEARAPFRYEADSEDLVDTFDVSVDVLNSRARSDGEYINLDAELCMGCTLMGREGARILQSATFGEKREQNGSEWTVYYIQDGENMWDIAKRYGVSQNEVKGNVEKDRFVLIQK